MRQQPEELVEKWRSIAEEAEAEGKGLTGEAAAHAASTARAYGLCAVELEIAIRAQPPPAPSE